ncbi:MAG: prepilin-type N-terminal cleavage/methylation domain-containing protein [Tepidisphaeraceae bacterium]
MAQQKQQCRPAFTLVELLVVIGIIGLLISILIPALNMARRHARDTECSAQLRQLANATIMYLNEHRRFPEPVQLAAFAGPVPLGINDRLINQIGPYLGWKPVKPTDLLTDMSSIMMCPFRKDLPLEYEYNYAMGSPYWNCGYSYCAGVGMTNNPSAVVLNDDRTSDLKGLKRRVIWSDNMFLLSGPVTGWVYFHLNGGGQAVEPTFLTFTAPTSYRGHHRAWSDGSVDWVRRGDFSLDPAQADTNAAYRITAPSGMVLYHFW